MHVHFRQPQVAVPTKTLQYRARVPNMTTVPTNTTTYSLDFLPRLAAGRTGREMLRCPWRCKLWGRAGLEEPEAIPRWDTGASLNLFGCSEALSLQAASSSGSDAIGSGKNSGREILASTRSEAEACGTNPLTWSAIIEDTLLITASMTASRRDDNICRTCDMTVVVIVVVIVAVALERAEDNRSGTTALRTPISESFVTKLPLVSL